MKKNKKGFTLIELLAIIVILAVIAVITTPIILNVIENSKKGAATNSALGYKDAIQKYYASKLFEDNNFELQGEFDIDNQGAISNELEEYQIAFSGTTPSGGYATIENGKLISGCVQINEYAVKFENGSVSETKKGICGPVLAEAFPQVTDENPGIICGNGETEDYDNSSVCYIYSVEDLVAFSSMVNSGKNFSGKTVQLMNNLDIENDNSYLNENSNTLGDVNEDSTIASTLKEELTTGKGFKPIGNDTNKFSGTFEGNAKTINNLFINRGTIDYVGLFGYNTGTIKGIKITDAELTGNNYIGIVAGRNDSSITSVIVDGDINGVLFLGLATGRTEGGKTEAVVSGNVTSSSTSESYPKAGGIVGYVQNGTTRGINLTGTITTEAGVIYKNIGDSWNAALKTISSSTVTANYDEDGLNYRGGQTVSVNNVKNIATLESVLDTYIGGDKDLDNYSDGYYYDNDINGDITIYSVAEKPLTITMTKDGDYYIINNYNDLKQAAYNVTEKYRLNTDISFSNKNPIMLASEANHFTGEFDGNAHTISNLELKGYDYVGLFGYNEGTVKGLKIDNSNATGYKNIGLLSGYNTGTITYTIVKGNVSGFQFLGLATGRTESGGTIESIVKGNVDSSNQGNRYAYAGGVVGCIQNSTIRAANLGGTITATQGEAYSIFGDSWNATKQSIGSSAVVAPNTSEGISSNSGKTYSASDLQTLAPYEEVGLNTSSTSGEYRYALDSNYNPYLIKN